MAKIVNVETKKDFLRRFLRTYPLKDNGCAWILSFFMANEHLLKNIHFVRDVSGCSRGLLISSEHTNSVPFRYHRGNESHTNVLIAFQEIRLNLEEEIYIQLNFPGRMEFPSFLAVLEKPYLLEQIDEDVQAVSYLAEKEADAFMEFMQEIYLQKEINRALDEKNPILFKKIQAKP